MKSLIRNIGILIFMGLLASTSFAEDWTHSALGNCETIAGTTTPSSGGLKASGGTAIVHCGLTKISQSDSTTGLFARVSGSGVICLIFSTTNSGGSISTSPAESSSSGFSSLNLPRNANNNSTGYEAVNCTLPINTTLHGIRHIQK